MKKTFRVFVYLIIAASIAVILLLFTCNYLVSRNAEGRLYAELDSVPQKEVGLLLGTAPQTRIGRDLNQFFKFRIEAAVALYKAGKIRSILISGDEHSLDGINEVECMRDSLVSRGVPDTAILLDGKGYRTFDAVARATQVYNQHTYVVISQKFHNERAIYLAEHLGLDVEHLVGFNATDPTYTIAIVTYLREYLARVKMFVDLMTDKKPEFMKKAAQEAEPEVAEAVESSNYTHREEKDSLLIYTPHYSRMDLVCGTMPALTDTNVIFCAEAAYTAQLLNEFKHSNILGDHVSSGKRYKGSPGKWNTGAFVYYNGQWKFLYQVYGKELDAAARNGGMGFGQECMIHEGKLVPVNRKCSNRNEFRALCELEGKLCVIDSKGVTAYGDFMQALLDAGVTEAIYLDMGPGWNYSWYRDHNGVAQKIHDKKIQYTTNWITFYK